VLEFVGSLLEVLERRMWIFSAVACRVGDVRALVGDEREWRVRGCECECLNSPWHVAGEDADAGEGKGADRGWKSCVRQ
jgi:hypothetical protein